MHDFQKIKTLNIIYSVHIYAAAVRSALLVRMADQIGDSRITLHLCL